MSLIKEMLVNQFSPGRGLEDIEHVVLHYSVSGRGAEDVAMYFAENPQRHASYHYIIGRDGQIVQCVRDEDTAWHARGVAPGEPKYKPYQNNRRSIGICLVNWGYDGPEDQLSIEAKPVRGGKLRRWQDFTDAQYVALEWLLGRLLVRHETLDSICGHEDCAAKADPGPAFDWGRLQYVPLVRWMYRGGKWRHYWLNEADPARARTDMPVMTEDRVWARLWAMFRNLFGTR